MFFSSLGYYCLHIILKKEKLYFAKLVHIELKWVHLQLIHIPVAVYFSFLAAHKNTHNIENMILNLLHNHQKTWDKRKGDAKTSIKQIRRIEKVKLNVSLSQSNLLKRKEKETLKTLFAQTNILRGKKRWY